MKVVKLHHQSHILAGSMGNRAEYTKTSSNPFEDEE